MARSFSPLRQQAVRGFALQILNTTLAVLIALSFDGLVESYRIRRLVATAQAHMDSEILENHKDVANAQVWAAKGKVRITECLEMLGELITARENQQEPPRSSSCGAEVFNVVLNTTSRSTAEATGAFGHMRYDEVKRYAGAYHFQEAITQTFQRLAAHYPSVLKFFKVNFRQLSLDELKVVRGDFLTYLLLLEQLSGQTKTMLMFYDKALGRR
jgi:hypothetical protein